MRNFKIAILTESITTHSGARAPIELAKNLAKLGNKITLYGHDSKLNQNLKNPLEESGVRVVTLQKEGSLLTSKLLPNFKLAKKLRKENYDIAIVAAFLPSALTAKLARIPTLRIYMGTQFDAYFENKLPKEKATRADHVLNFLANIYIYSADLISIYLSNHVVAISKYCATQMRRLFGKRADKIIYLGGNHLPKKIGEERKSNKTLTLLSVSRITPYKDFHYLIGTVNQLKAKNIELVIAGSPEKPRYLDYLKEIASEKVKIILNPSDSQLSRLYQNCDVLVTADKNLFFGFPIAEAAFFAKPAISANFAAAKELVENGRTGFIVKNQKELLKSLEFYSKNPKSLKEIGARAKIRAQKLFDWPKISHQYNKFLNQIIT